MRRILYLFLILLLLSGCQESNSNNKEESLKETKTDEHNEKYMFTIDAYLQDVENVLELNSKNLIDKFKEIHNLTFYAEETTVKNLDYHYISLFTMNINHMT